MQIEHDIKSHRFVARLPAGEAVLAYTPAGEKRLDFYSTFVPPAARGKGIAAQLVSTALDYARAEGFQVIASCWYVSLWFRRHPEQRDLLVA
jgi:uncharacterized protein